LVLTAVRLKTVKTFIILSNISLFKQVFIIENKYYQEIAIRIYRPKGQSLVFVANC